MKIFEPFSSYLEVPVGLFGRPTAAAAHSECDTIRTGCAAAAARAAEITGGSCKSSAQVHLPGDGESIPCAATPAS